MKIVQIEWRMSYWVIVLFIACNNPAAENKIDKSYEKKTGKDELNIVLAKALDQQAENSITKVFVDYDHRTEKQIISFAKAPASYRYNSRMPAMNGLSDKEFENIILYLKYMKDHKNTH